MAPRRPTVHMAGVRRFRGDSFHATLIRDAVEAAAVKIEHLTVSSSDPLSVNLSSGGGFVAMIKR